MKTPNKKVREWVAQMDMVAHKLYIHKNDRTSLYRCLDGRKLECYDRYSNEWKQVDGQYYFGKEKAYREY